MGLFSFLGRRMTQPEPTMTAVVLAAGSSTRMGGVDKQFALIDGVPVLARTLLAFEQADCVQRIVIVTSAASIIAVQDLCRDYGISKAGDILPGGATRLESSLIGVNAAGECDLVAVHDGARPLVTPELIKRVRDAAKQHKAAIPAIPLNDTIKRVEKKLVAKGAPPRSELVAVQTPQIFDTALLRGALAKAAQSDKEFTDDASAVEALGMSVCVAEGDARNIKITRPLDLAIAEAIIAAEEEEI